jgi:hypothetical protein
VALPEGGPVIRVFIIVRSWPEADIRVLENSATDYAVAPKILNKNPAETIRVSGISTLALPRQRQPYKLQV